MMCKDKLTTDKSSQTNMQSGTANAHHEASYPEELLHVSTSNARACVYFEEALEALKNNRFPLPQHFMETYQSLVQYKDFYIHDNRTQAAPLISVIIVTYNTKTDLIKCIKSVFAGSLKEIEIIVVDNGKNAEVLPLLLAMPLLYVKAPMNLVLSEGRNIGVSFAKAPIGAFVDDDGLADKHFCAQALVPFKDEGIIAVRGKVLPKTQDAMQPTSWHYDFGPKPIFCPINTEGCSAWRLKEYRECGGLDPILFGHEGTDLSVRYTLKQGFGKTLYWPGLILFHDYAFTFNKITAKDQRHQQMFDFLAWKTPEAHAIISYYDQVRENSIGVKKESIPTLPPPIPRKKERRSFIGEPESICFFIPSLGSGGAERQVVYLAKALAVMGKTVHILCLQLENERGHFLSLLQDTPVTCRTLNKQDMASGQAYAESNADRFRSIFTLRMNHNNVLALVGALLEIKPDILHCYLDDASCIGGCAGLAVDLPGVVLSARSSPPYNISDYSHITEWTKPVYTFLLQHNTIIIEANSSTGAKDYESWLALPESSVRINNNGFDDQSFDITVKRTRENVLFSLGLSASSPIVVWVGKYNNTKNPSDMAAIANRVREKLPNVRFLAVGNLLERVEESQTLLADNNLQETVIFLGVRYDIQELLSASDVFLLTSTIEGFPNAIMEAMASGLPVVSTRVGAVPEMVTAEVGFVHTVGDISGMADSVLTLLASPELRRQMGAAGKERVSKLFTMENLVNRTLAIYHDVIANADKTSCKRNF